MRSRLIKALNNRFYVKFMQLEIGLLALWKPSFNQNVFTLTCYEAYFVALFSNIWRQILFPGDLHDAALWNFCTTECGTFNLPMRSAASIPVRLSNYRVTFNDREYPT